MSEPPQLVVGIGDIKIGKDPATIRTNLGSCIGVCLYNAQAKSGGMLHCMFPTAADRRDKADFRAAKYADSGVQELVAELKRVYGLEPHGLVAKIFGGASMLKIISSNIGQMNENSARAVLKELHIPVVELQDRRGKGISDRF